jgi:hypothetical protein
MSRSRSMPPFILQAYTFLVPSHAILPIFHDDPPVPHAGPRTNRHDPLYMWNPCNALVADDLHVDTHICGPADGTYLTAEWRLCFGLQIMGAHDKLVRLSHLYLTFFGH